MTGFSFLPSLSPSFSLFFFFFFFFPLLLERRHPRILEGTESNESRAYESSAVRRKPDASHILLSFFSPSSLSFGRCAQPKAVWAERMGGAKALSSTASAGTTRFLLPFPPLSFFLFFLP